LTTSIYIYFQPISLFLYRNRPPNKASWRHYHSKRRPIRYTIKAWLPMYFDIRLRPFSPMASSGYFGLKNGTLKDKKGTTFYSNTFKKLTVPTEALCEDLRSLVAALKNDDLDGHKFYHAPRSL